MDGNIPTSSVPVDRAPRGVIAVGGSEGGAWFDDGPGQPRRRRRGHCPCRGRHLYRYLLWRRWRPGGDWLAWVMLNPSTAGAADDDATIERCRRRSARLGFGGLLVVNLFAWRATDPAALRLAEDPIGPHNDEALAFAARHAQLIVCAWGAGGAFDRRAAAVLEGLRGRPLYALGFTVAGHPRHPLYVAYREPARRWTSGAHAGDGGEALGHLLGEAAVGGGGAGAPGARVSPPPGAAPHQGPAPHCR
jgi:hypothetical protein